MAWTTPGTATAGEVLTAAFWNEQVRDNSAAIRDAQVNVQQTVVTAAGVATASLASGGTIAFPGLTVDITPTSATSKILVRAHVMGSADGVLGFGFFLTRDATAIDAARGDSDGSRSRISGSCYATTADILAGGDLVYLDSPATTSQVTYAVTIVNTRSIAAGIFYNRTVTDSNTAQYARGMSSIVVQEIPV